MVRGFRRRTFTQTRIGIRRCVRRSQIGSLLVDFPFEPNVWLAFSIIFIPTLLNCAKWKQVSDEDSAAAART